MNRSPAASMLLLASLLLAGCVANTPSPVPARTSALAPDPLPRPSPSAPAAGITTGPAPAMIPSRTTVASVLGPDRPGETQPAWTRYSSINQVMDLAFAPDGRLWASTGGGLVAWDLESETYVLYEVEAFHLAVAPDGSLWLATAHGLCHFDGSRCEYPPPPHGIGSGGIYALAVAPDGTLWAGSEAGVLRFDGASWTDTGLAEAPNDLATGTNGEVWAATGSGAIRNQPGQEAWQFYGQAEGLPDSQAVAIGVSPSGEAWTAMAWDGVYRLNGERWLQVEDPPGRIVRTIEVADNGRPWVGTVGSLHYPGGTLSYWDGQGWTDVSSQAGLISIQAIAHGPGGVVAAATQRGLGLYEAGQWRLLRDGPASGRVVSVAVTPDGTTWFAFGDQSPSTVGSGLSRFDGQGWDYFLDDSEVGALAVAPDGALWAGIGCGVQRYDGSTWELVGRCQQDLPLGNAMGIEFTTDGVAWVATGFNLARYDGLEWTFYDKLVNRLLAGPDGSLWVEGWEGRQDSWYVARVAGEEWTIHRLSESYPGQFRPGAVTPDGRLWGMVEGRGLASFDGADWREGSSWSFYHPDDSAPEPISLLGASDGGALWLSTAKGVTCFVPPANDESIGTWTHYPVEDRLGGFAATALAIGPEGELWFNNVRLLLPPAE